MSAVVVSESGLFARLGRPPVPREHGTWFMFYVPMIAVLIGTDAAWDRVGVLALTVTAGFCGQFAARLAVRGRGGQGVGLWLGIYATVFLLGCAVMILGYGLTDLLWIGAPALGVLGWQIFRSRQTRKRVDRTLSGEFLAVAALTLTAPAAWIMGMGDLSRQAVGLWGAYVLFFGSSVFYVKMRITAVQVKAGIQFLDRVRLGWTLVLYHGFVLVNLVVFHRLTNDGMSTALLIGFLPVMLRALLGWIRLSNRMPNLTRVGLIESVYTLWFSGWLAVAMRSLEI